MEVAKQSLDLDEVLCSASNSIDDDGKEKVDLL